MEQALRETADGFSQFIDAFVDKYHTGQPRDPQGRFAGGGGGVMMAPDTGGGTGGGGSVSAGELESKVCEIEKSIVNRPYETLAVYDKGTGERLIFREGNRNSIEVTDNDLRHTLRGTVGTHQHPTQKRKGGVVLDDIPFSGADAYVMLAGGMKEFRAVTPAGHRFILRPGKFKGRVDRSLAGELQRDLHARADGHTKAGMKKVIDDVKRHRISKKVANKKIDEYFHSTAMHKAWIGVAKDRGLTYKREKI